MYYKTYNDSYRSAKTAVEIMYKAGGVHNLENYLNYEVFLEEEKDSKIKEDYIQNLSKEEQDLFSELHNFAYPIWYDDFRLCYLNGNGTYTDWLQDCLENAYST